MGERIALVGRITPKQREGMAEHLRLLSEGEPHCETWTWQVRPCLRERLQEQISADGGISLWVMAGGTQLEVLGQPCDLLRRGRTRPRPGPLHRPGPTAHSHAARIRHW